MPAVIDATPGGSAANSFATQAEVDSYFESRAPLSPPWVSGAAANIPVIIMAARVLSAFAVARRVLREGKPDGGNGPYGSSYYVVSRAWTGVISTDTQALSWPRTGMFDRNGRLIPANIVPIELKEAQAELAGVLKTDDRTLDLQQDVQGLESLKAGPVELVFRERQIASSAMLPEFVLTLLPGSWLTDELIVPAQSFVFFTA